MELPPDPPQIKSAYKYRLCMQKYTQRESLQHQSVKVVSLSASCLQLGQTHAKYVSSKHNPVSYILRMTLNCKRDYIFVAKVMIMLW